MINFSFVRPVSDVCSNTCARQRKNKWNLFGLLHTRAHKCSPCEKHNFPCSPINQDDTNGTISRQKHYLIKRYISDTRKTSRSFSTCVRPNEFTQTIWITSLHRSSGIFSISSLRQHACWWNISKMIRVFARPWHDVAHEKLNEKWRAGKNRLA